VSRWLLDKSAAARVDDPITNAELNELAGQLCICPVSRLEQLYAARSADGYEALLGSLDLALIQVAVPDDIFDQALSLQRDLAHHHGMWHRIAIPDLLIAVTALHHEIGVVHVDADYQRIGEVRPLLHRRLQTS